MRLVKKAKLKKITSVSKKKLIEKRSEKQENTAIDNRK